MNAWVGPLFSFLSSVTWGYGSTNYSKLSRDHHPMDVNFSRAAFALPCFIVAVFLVNGISGGIAAFQALGSRQLAWFSLSMLASYALGDLLFLLSTVALGVPGALAVGSGYPIMTALVGAFFEGQTLQAHQWAGLFLAISGIVVVILNDPKGAPKDGSEVRAHPFLRKKWVGVLLGVGTAISWTANTFSVAKGGAGISPLAGNALRMAIALVMITILSLLANKRPARVLDRPTMRRYSWIFVAESFFGSLFFMYGLSHSSLVLGSTLASLAPVISVPISIALKLERFSWVRSLAVVTVVVGLSLIFR